MSERLYFDCHASYGPKTGVHPQARWSLDHLREDLDLAGIAGALVSHAQGVLYDPMISNRRLLKDLAPWRDRLYPCWTILPPLRDQSPVPRDLMRMMDDGDVRAVQIEPRVFGLPLAPGIWGDLVDALRQRGTPVLTAMDGWPPDPPALDRLLDLFTGVPVVFLDAHWSQWRWMVHLMGKHPHLHLEFATFQANRAIEYFAGQFGAGRCLFGTGLPQKAPGAARGFLDWTLLDADQAAMVAGGNLKRLLHGAGPATIPLPGQWQDALTAAARAGESLPCRIWDDHCHILHEGGGHAGGTHYMHQGGPQGMIELIRRVGIEKTAVMSWAGPLSGDADTGNAIVAEAVAAYPGELVGLVTIRPELQGLPDIEQTIRTYHLGLRFPGLKPFPRDTLDYDDPLFAPWFEFANRHSLYMVYDPAQYESEAGTSVIEHLTTRYPNLQLHLDHCGRSWPFAIWAVEMVHRFPQVYAQLNYTAVTNGVIEFLVGNAGADRVLFGTDAPMRDPRPQVGWLVFTRLAEEDKRRIFGLNFQRILSQAVANLEKAAAAV